MGYQGTWRYRVNHAAPLERGRIHFSAERYDDAIQAFKQVLEVAPDEVIALRGLARCYKAKGEFDVAAAWVKAAVKHDKSPRSHVLAAEIACLRAGHRQRDGAEGEALTKDQVRFLEKALAHAAAAIEMDASHSPAHRCAAEACARLGQTDRALEYIRQGAEAEPGSFMTRIEAVDHLVAAGQRGEALEHALYAADKIPGEDPRALRRVAQVYWDLQLYDKAIEYLVRLKESRSDANWALAQLAKCYIRKEQYVTALRCADEAMAPFEANPGKAQRNTLVPELQFVRGAAHYELGNYDKAIVDFTRSATALSNSHLYFLLGMAYRQAGQRELARHAFLEAIALEPAHIGARREVVELLAQDGETEQALRQLQGVVARRDGDGESCRLLIEFCQAWGLENEAEAELRQLLEKRPGGPGVAAELARLCLRAGRGDEAILFARMALQGEPANAGYRLLEARAEAERGNTDRAASAFARLVALDPGNREAYLAWADACHEAGRLADARDVYQRALIVLPADAGLRSEYGRFLLATGRTAEGNAQLRNILEQKVDADIMFAYEPSVDHYLKTDNPVRARHEVGLALRTVPMNVPLQSLLMRVLRAQGDWQAFTGGLSQIAGELDKRAFVTYQRVAAYVHQGIYDAAGAVAEEALTLFPEHARIIKMDLAIVNFLGGKEAEGIEQMGLLLAVDDQDPNTGIALSLMHMLHGSEVAGAPACRGGAMPPIVYVAWTDLAGLHKKAPKTARTVAASLLKAMTYENAGWHDVAAAECEAILRDYAGCVIARRLAPVLWDRAGRSDKAIVLCRKLLADGGPAVGLQEVLADLLLLDGAVEAARETYGRGASVRDASADVVTKHALMENAVGHGEAAAKAYRLLLEGETQDVVGKHNLAWLLAAKDDSLPEALDLAEFARGVLSNHPAVNDTSGWVRYRSGDYVPAINLFERAVELAPHRGLYHFHLGLALWRGGRAPEAADALERALGLDPDAPFAERARQVLLECRF